MQSDERKKHFISQINQVKAQAFDHQTALTDCTEKLRNLYGALETVEHIQYLEKLNPATESKEVKPPAEFFHAE